MSRKCAASFTSNMASKALYDGGLQVRASLDTRLQNYAVSALRSGLVRYDRRHGWRGAKNHIDANGDWRAKLIKLPNQSGIETWRLAVALGYDAESYPDRLCRRHHRRRSPMTATNGPAGNCPARSGARPDHAAGGGQAGRCLLCRADAGAGQAGRIRPAPGAGGQRRHRGDGPAYRPRAGHVGRLLLCLVAVRPRHAGAAPARFLLQALRLCHGAGQWLYARPARCWTRPSRWIRARARASGGRRISRRANFWATPPCAAAWNCRAT